MRDDPQRPSDQTDPADEASEAGLGHDLGSVDLQAARDVAGDPPGALGLDLGGGSGDLGVENQPDQPFDN